MHMRSTTAQRSMRKEIEAPRRTRGDCTEPRDVNIPSINGAKLGLRWRIDAARALWQQLFPPFLAEFRDVYIAFGVLYSSIVGGICAWLGLLLGWVRCCTWSWFEQGTWRESFEQLWFCKVSFVVILFHSGLMILDK